MSVVEYNLRPRKKHKTSTLKVEAQKAVRMLITTLTSMIAVLAIMLLIISNASAQKGYTLQQQKIRNESLKSESTNLSTKLTNTTTFADIQDNTQIKEMTAETSKIYVNKEDNTPK